MLEAKIFSKDKDKESANFKDKYRCYVSMKADLG